MKMRKTISMVCCVIIASMGIALTGCGGSSSAESTVKSSSAESTVESNSAESTVESSSVESTVESSSEKYADSPYVGTWVATVTEYEGTEYDAEEVIGASEFTFNADGTGKFVADGVQLDLELEPTEDGLKFTDFNGDGYFTYKDKELLLDVETKEIFITTHFEKAE